MTTMAQCFSLVLIMTVLYIRTARLCCAPKKPSPVAGKQLWNIEISLIAERGETGKFIASFEYYYDFNYKAVKDKLQFTTKYVLSRKSTYKLKAQVQGKTPTNLLGFSVTFEKTDNPKGGNVTVTQASINPGRLKRTLNCKKSTKPMNVTPPNALICVPQLTPTSPRCAKIQAKFNGAKIFNRKPKPSSDPWYAALRFQDRSKSARDCGALIIHEYWVVTSGYCAFDLSKMTDLKVTAYMLTDPTMCSGGFDVGVEKIFVPESYKDSGNCSTKREQSDIALIKVRKPFMFSPTVLPACIVSSSNSVGKPKVTGRVIGCDRSERKPKKQSTTSKIVDIGNDMFTTNGSANNEIVNFAGLFVVDHKKTTFAIGVVNDVPKRCRKYFPVFVQIEAWFGWIVAKMNAGGTYYF